MHPVCHGAQHPVGADPVAPWLVHGLVEQLLQPPLASPAAARADQHGDPRVRAGQQSLEHRLPHEPRDPRQEDVLGRRAAAGSGNGGHRDSCSVLGQAMSLSVVRTVPSGPLGPGSVVQNERVPNTALPIDHPHPTLSETPWEAGNFVRNLRNFQLRRRARHHFGSVIVDTSSRDWAEGGDGPVRLSADSARVRTRGRTGVGRRHRPQVGSPPAVAQARPHLAPVSGAEVPA